jgi:hypothetical protein
MSENSEMSQLEELAKLLEQQVVLARRGGFEKLQQLAGRCGPLVAKITAAGLFEKPEHKAAKERLTGLYQKLQMALSSQKDAVAEQLRSVCEHKRKLTAYRSGI